MTRRRRVSTWLLLVLISMLAAGESALRRLDVTVTATPVSSTPHRTIRVATLNVAHGRGDSLNQLLVSEARTRANLEAIGRFLLERDIHIAALQEVDSPSWWSGDFDHATAIAVAGGFSHYAQASHAHLGIADYGTAILSRLPVTAAAAVDFAPSPPTAGKGFTVAEIAWRLDESTPLTLDVISIHMDFSRASVRESQLAELEAAMASRQNPVLIMGDFNSEALARRLVDRSADNPRRLHTVADAGGTHASYKEKRLDWIIASGDIEIIHYHTDPAELSDHRAVIATIRLRDAPAPR